MANKLKKPATVNGEALNTWLGQDNERLLRLSDKTGLSIFTIYLMRRGSYNHEPKPFTRAWMTKVTGISEEKLFPNLKTQKSAESV